MNITRKNKEEKTTATTVNTKKKEIIDIFVAYTRTPRIYIYVLLCLNINNIAITKLM